MDPIFCLVATSNLSNNRIDDEDVNGKSRGNSIASAYGITDLSGDGCLPDQMANLTLQPTPAPPPPEPELLEVIETFSKCSSALEIPVQAGEIVTYLGSEGSWVFVRTANGADGYIPRRSCRVIHKRNEKNPMQHDLSDVGYYSDHQHNEHDNDRRTRCNEFLSGHQRQFSSHDVYDGMHYRADSESSSTNGSGGGFSHRELAYNNSLRRTSDVNSIDSRERMYGSVPPSPAVCGRKCGNRCIHKTTPDSVQTLGNPSEIQLKVKNYPSEFDHPVEEYIDLTNEHDDVIIENNHMSEEYTTEIHDTVEIDGEIKTVGSIRRCSNNITSYNRARLQEEIDDKKRLQRNLQVNKKVINHVRTTLDEHRRVQKIAASYWKDAGTKLRHKGGKIRSHKKSKTISAPEGLILSVCGHPELIVIKDYKKVGDTDISASCGDFATIINDTKYTDWVFVQNENGERGYIPTECTLKHECEDCENIPEDDAEKYVRLIAGEDHTNFKPKYDDMDKLIIHEDFSSDHPDELRVSIGDTVYLSKNVQPVQDWLWVYSPKQKKCGYIPVSMAKDESEVEIVTV